jgi:hypothetical protein
MLNYSKDFRLVKKPFVRKKSVNPYLLLPSSDVPPMLLRFRKICIFADVKLYHYACGRIPANI